MSLSCLQTCQREDYTNDFAQREPRVANTSFAGDWSHEPVDEDNVVMRQTFD